MQIMISLLIAMALKTTLPDPEDPDSKFFGARKNRSRTTTPRVCNSLPYTSRGNEHIYLLD